jgi:hypothetical protein
MAVGDFDPFKQPGESDEQHRHRLEEAVLPRIGIYGSQLTVLHYVH